MKISREKQKKCPKKEEKEEKKKIAIPNQYLKIIFKKKCAESEWMNERWKSMEKVKTTKYNFIKKRKKNYNNITYFSVHS